MAQALFGSGDKSGLSIPAIVTAQNDPPVAENDTYNSENIEGDFVVGNLFDNDMDPDFGLLVDVNGDGVFVAADGDDVPDKSRWTAVDAAGNPLMVDGLMFTGVPGAFTYDPSYGSVTFDYKIKLGGIY